ncbi:hypothetical protein VNO80_27352 [Phaseolus coccineus]|uniref:BHLH domain-containing protein n=1 Tax=Phaseolus coccineus TaxID=3886 RepID=A0AAN9LL93_PHACN
MGDQQQRDRPSLIKGGGALSRGDLIDEATNYIKNLETQVKMAQQKKESLLQQKKRSRSASSSSYEAPKIEIHEMDSFLQIILMCAVGNQFILTEIIRILHERP